ncbi:aryl-sulfate sulfotransferase [Lactiplantibacillus mudanjiangensis]|uniref:aryl-sulfate sulfotransferase n=1 Tax=Lactiplantibacillus mudanjiangensis TaxID=1296538 RepID=UPI00102F3502|nr:aryl-sulfate sulfotransferase [Lactiplantibacillus mudanjiangensis]
MKSGLRSKPWLIGGILIVVLAIVGGSVYWQQSRATPVKDVARHANQVEKQGGLSTATIKKRLQPTLSTTGIKSTQALTKTYTQQLESLSAGAAAKVITNPYQTSPLSALILVKTKAATQVTTEVVGDSKATTITHTIKGYQTSHQIGVLGLYAGRTNQVKVTYTTKAGKKTTKTYAIKTAKAPAEIGTNTLKTSTPSKMSLGTGNTKLTFAVSSQGLTYGLDAQGQIRWYATNKISHVFKTLKNGHLLILTKKTTSDSKYNALRITDYYGRVYKQYDFSGVFPTKADPKKTAVNTVIHHDVIEMPNGDFLLTVDDGSAKYVEDTMIQIDHQTGKIKKVIDLKRVLFKSAYTKYDATSRSDGKLDWFHQNSMAYDQKHNLLLVSGRNQSMILGLNYRTGKLKWILGADQKIPASYQKYLIKPAKGTHFQYNGGQHAINIVGESDSGNVLQLEYYDNNVAVTRGDLTTSKQYSIGTEVRLNQKQKTVKTTWSYGKSRGTKNFTNIVGSSYQVGQGNTLIGFGYADSGKRSEFVEVNRKTNQVVFDVNRTNFSAGDWSYRAERLSLYPTY